MRCQLLLALDLDTTSEKLHLAYHAFKHARCPFIGDRANRDVVDPVIPTSLVISDCPNEHTPSLWNDMSTFPSRLLPSMEWPVAHLVRIEYFVSGTCRQSRASLSCLHSGCIHLFVLMLCVASRANAAVSCFPLKILLSRPDRAFILCDFRHTFDTMKSALTIP
jgi:hypothetical protein